MDILINFGVPIITALISYLVAIKTQNTKLKETKLKLQQEIEALEKNHELKLKELEKEMEIQNKTKQNDVMLDIMGGFMGSALEDPEKLENLLALSDKVKGYQKKDTK